MLGFSTNGNARVCVASANSGSKKREKMASNSKMPKFLKHLGIGGKSKGPPPTPKADYSAQKSSSVQELLPKSPASERSRVSMSATTSGISEFDNTGSPLHRTDKYGGARPKEPPGGGLSPKQSSERHSMISCADDGGILGPAATDGPPPQLVDEYSDPFDLKKQIAENPELSGALAPAPLVDDDYSVPYEVKRLKEMKLREVGDGARNQASRKAGGQLYDEPYQEGSADFSPTRTRYMADAVTTRDYRPREDYDEPWEWSAKQRSIFFQPHMGGDASSQNVSSANQKGTPLMTKRTSDQVKGLGTEPNGEQAAEEEEVDGPDYVNAPRPGKHLANHADEDEDDEGYTHLREEFGSRGPSVPAVVNNTPSKADDNKVPAEVTVGNYEEPWDLSFTQKDLEDKLKAASDRASRVGNSSGVGGTVTAVTAVTDSSDSSPQRQDPMPHETDLRPQEGYEKPWDWKPHKKDDRGQEGYEKPWDLKPHQKDDRPPEEYEEPWDQKVKDIERDLIKAKSAKVALKDKKQVEDPRPMEEYDQPWDQKKNKALVSRTASDSSVRSGQCLALCAQADSPNKKHKTNMDIALVAERVDPKLPLDQQGWYHGSISRVDAENLLRVHKEGSYLVRMSESNKLDFSLSLKSERGFMHMKIVSRDSHYILGQFSQPFESIPQMIHHYSISKLPIKGAYHMSLLHPVINELL